MNTLNTNILDIISLTEDALRGVFEDNLSAKDAVLQARCKEAAREGKNLFDEPLTSEEEASERDLWNLAIEYAITRQRLTLNQYLDWLKDSPYGDSEERFTHFNNAVMAVWRIIICLRCPEFIEGDKEWLGEEAVQMLQYITTGGINHKAPAFVIA